jgi:hypothetical protein
MSELLFVLLGEGMWKFIRIILLFATVLIVSGMYAAAPDCRSESCMGGTGETVISPEDVLFELAGESATRDELAVHVQAAYDAIQQQKSLLGSANRWGMIKADRSLAYNMGIRLFSLLGGLNICGDLLEFNRVCSIVRFPAPSEKVRVRVILNVGEIDSQFRSKTAFGRQKLQAATAYDFVAVLIQVLCAWVNSQEKISAFELILEGLPDEWGDLPVNSTKLTTLCA